MRALRVCRSPTLFRPHIHREGCQICHAARMTEDVDVPRARPPTQQTQRQSATKPTRTHRLRTEPQQHAPLEKDAASMLTRREAAFATWLQQFGSESTPPLSTANPVTVFLDPSTDFSQTRLSEAVNYLDAFCHRATQTGRCVSADVEKGGLLPSEVRVPLPSVIRFDTPGTHARTASVVPTSLSTPFDAAVSRLPAKQQVKQRRFQRALLDFQRVLATRTNLRFFLACGTAVAVHREGCFIPHDDDVDVGVFLEDLAELGRRGDAPSPTDTREAVQRGTVRLLSDLCADAPLFAVFDVCGEMERGLELRFLHRATGVKLDLNVYYPPFVPQDNALVAAEGPFVWHSSFYEQAHQRRFGMYRFKQTPFATDLLHCPFCEAARGAGQPAPTGFLVPPRKYLDEYFGDDWHTPRSFTYEQGLRSEYKNIIQE